MPKSVNNFYECGITSGKCLRHWKISPAHYTYIEQSQKNVRHHDDPGVTYMFTQVYQTTDT